MADYGCYPLWWASYDKAGDIDPETMPLSKETISRLEKWADIYDAKLNWEDPNSSSFPSLEAKEATEKFARERGFKDISAEVLYAAKESVGA